MKNNNKILTITSSHDLTIDYILKKHPNVNLFRLNLDQFSKYEVSIDSENFHIRSSNNEEINSGTCKSIYYRKPSFEDLSGVFEAQYHDFVHREAYTMIEGIAEGFDGLCLSRPSRLRAADNKIKQLSLAQKCGFKIPKSLITNSAKSSEGFRTKECIVKPVASGTVTYLNSKEFVQTNIVNPEIDISSLTYSPCYFQEYINKDYEVRATVVGSNIIAVRIDSDDKVDWRRPGNDVHYSLYKLPENIKK